MNININSDGVRVSRFTAGPSKKTHRELFEKLVKADVNSKPLEKALLVLCTPRCGSTLFAEALNNSGRVGICEEWLNNEYFDAYIDVVGKSFELREYMEFVTSKSIGDTGVLSLKLHIGQLAAANERFGLGIESMDFDHVVYLYRRDKVSQAVSLTKAALTNQFRSYEKSNPIRDVDFSSVAHYLNSIVEFDQFARNYLWQYVDAEHAYEDFQRLGSASTRPHESYNDVLVALGKRPCHSFTAGRLKKQADHRSEMTIKGFKAYITGDNDATS